MIVVAYTYHFQPSEIDELYIEDLLFWANGINWINDKTK
jgi:hypothetical protein